MTTLSRQPVTQAIADALAADVAWADVDVGEREVSPPAITVHSAPGGSVTALLTGTGRSGELPYRLGCVGYSWEQAEALADAAHASLQGLKGTAGIGRVRIIAWPDTVPVEATRDPVLWQSRPQFAVTVDA